MSFSIVVASGVVGRGAPPLRWVPVKGQARLREAAVGLEALDADPDFGTPAPEGSTRIPPRLGASDVGRVAVDEAGLGLLVRVLEGAGASATLVDRDLGGDLGPTPRSWPVGRLLALRPGKGETRLLAVEGEGPDALARALARGAHDLDALPDKALGLALAAAPRSNEIPWRPLDLALRERRDARAPFLAALDETSRIHVHAAWESAIQRILARHGLPASRRALSDAARDWFVQIRTGIERQRSFATLAREAFALEVALSLDALGEEPGFTRLVPLAREQGRDTFQLTLSRKDDPEYRTFSVVRTDEGGAIVSGRTVQRAKPQQRVRKMTCSCGGRIHEGDGHCRGCGTAIEDLGPVRMQGTFMVGITAEVCAVCECGSGIGAEDRFCGGCGRSLEGA